MALLISFWGKGGTGKSTIAAAAAKALAAEGLSVVAVSTDLTPALGSLLCGASAPPGRLVECSGVKVWEAREEDVKRLWVERFGDEVYEVVSSLLPVGREIIGYVAGAPGIADQFMMYLVYTLVEESGADIVVWDTAAAGGSLRLLRIERELYSHLGEAASLYLRVRGALERLRRRSGKTPLELIEEWRRLAENILGLLQSSERHRLVLVASPDRLSVEVTRALIQEFRVNDVEPARLLVNRVIEGSPCPGCSIVEEEERQQGEALEALRGLGVPMCTVPLVEPRPSSPQGLERLVPLVERCIRGLV